MDVSNSQSKRREKGCGKWLRKKGNSMGNTKQQLQIFESCLTIKPKPIIFEGKNKSGKMKQSKMSQFLVEKTSKIKKDKIISNHKINSITTTREKGEVPRKRVSPERIKYDNSEDLWRSDSDEDDTHQTKENVQKTNQVEKDNILNDMSLVCCKDENSLKGNYICTKKEQKHTEKHLFPASSKRVRKSKDNMDLDLGERSDSTGLAFTEWFENEVEEFIQHHNDYKSLLTKETLFSISNRYPSSCKVLSDSEEELPQFSEWFNQQIEMVNQREPPNNIFQSPTRNCSQPDSTFTQWFEDNLENIRSPS